MARLLSFYRTTEGLVTAMSLYVALAFLISAVAPAAAGGPVVFGALFAVFALLAGGLGLFLYADAARRVFDAVNERLTGFFIEAMNA